MFVLYAVLFRSFLNSKCAAKSANWLAWCKYSKHPKSECLDFRQDRFGSVVKIVRFVKTEQNFDLFVKPNV